MTANIFLSGRKARTLRRGTQNTSENETNLEKKNEKRQEKMEIGKSLPKKK